MKLARAIALLSGLYLGTGIALATDVKALPTGGEVVAGSGHIGQSGSQMTVTQSSERLITNWDTFNIGSGAEVRFVQPGASSVALNRILDASPSEIFGKLSSNGQVFLLNPNGIYFGASAQVNVGGLVASSLSLTDKDFLAGHYRFTRGDAGGPVDNQGRITARGGVIALIAPQVTNRGTITANGGTALLAAGDRVALDFEGDGLVTVNVDKGAFNALADNHGLIQADGGRVVMTAQGAGALLDTVVNNDGVIRAQTLESKAGRILLLGGMEHDRVNVGGTLDASAPNGGDGGFIETSAADVRVDGATITTLAPAGKTGDWLIDPNDYTIAASGGDITGAALAATLNSTNVTIQTTVDGTAGGNGDIFVNDAVAKTGGGNTTLTLEAERHIEINEAVSSSGGALNVVLTADADGNHTGDVSFGATGSVSTAGGNFISGSLSGENVSAGGEAFTMASGSYIDTSGNDRGRLVINQSGDITLADNSLRATTGLYYANNGGYTGQANYIQLQTPGSILTTNTSAATPDIVSSADVNLTAAGIGSANAGEQIKISGPAGLGGPYASFPNYARALNITNLSGSSYVNEIGHQIFGWIGVNVGTQANSTQNIQIMGDAGGNGTSGTGHIIMSTDGAGMVQLGTGDISTFGLGGHFDAGTPANSTDPAIFPTSVSITAGNITFANDAVDMGPDTFYWPYPGYPEYYPYYTHASFSASADTLVGASNDNVADINGLEIWLTASDLGTALKPLEIGHGFGGSLGLYNVGGSTFVKSVDDSFSSIMLYSNKAVGSHSVLFSGGDHIDYTTDGNGIIVPTIGARSDGESFATTTGIDTTGSNRSVTLMADFTGYIEYDTNSVNLGAGTMTSVINSYNTDRNAGRGIYAKNAKDGLAEITAGSLEFDNFSPTPAAIDDIEFAKGGSLTQNTLSVTTYGGDVDLTELTPDHITGLNFTLQGPSVAEDFAVNLAGADDVHFSDDGSLVTLDATKVNLSAGNRDWNLYSQSRTVQIDGVSLGSGDYSVNGGIGIALNGDVMTNGGAIHLTAGGSGLRLLKSARIDSNADNTANSASTGASGTILLQGAISATSGNHELTVDSGSTTGDGGQIYFYSNTGNAGGDYLGGLTLTAKGSTDVNDGAVYINGTSYLLNGDFASTGNSILSGGSVTIDTEQGNVASGGDITFSGYGLYTYPYYSYTFDTSTTAAGMDGGDVDLHGTYAHSTLTPGSLAITSTGGTGGDAGNISLPAVTTDYSGVGSTQTYRGQITLYGDLRTNGGAISLSGDTRLADSATLDTWSGTSTPANGAQQTRSAGSVTIDGEGVSALGAGMNLTIDTTTDTGPNYFDSPTDTVSWSHSGGNVSVAAGNAGGSMINDLAVTTSAGGAHNTGSDGIITLADTATTGNQTYNGPLVLHGNASLTTANSDITFNGTLNDTATHQSSLTVNTGTGTMTFADVVGGSVQPFGLYVTGPTTILADMTFGRAELFSPVTLGANLTLSQTCCYGLHFHDTVDGAHDLTLLVDGVAFDGDVGGSDPLTSLMVTGTTGLSAGITTSGTQTYNGNILLVGQNASLTQTDADLDFTLQAGRTVDYLGGGQSGFAIHTTGDIVLAAGSSIGSSTGTLNVTLAADSDGDGGAIVMGANSGIFANGGDIVLQANTLSADATARLQSSGSLSIVPRTTGATIGVAGGAGTLQLSTANFTTNFVDGFSEIIVGSSSAGALTVGGDLALKDSLRLASGGNIALQGDLDGAGNTLTLGGGSGATVTSTGSITADNLLLDGNDTIYTLNTAGAYAVGALAVANARSVNFRNTGSLIVGTVNGVDGVTATHGVTLEANGASADLTLEEAVSNTSGTLVLVAGRNFINHNAAGTGLNPGSGRYLVYSANPAASTEAMSGYSKHYHQSYVAGATPGYAGTGNWFLYSVAPVIGVASATQSVTYGDTPLLTPSYSGFIDGDSAGTAGISGDASFTVGGNTSSSGHLIAGLHDVQYTSGLLSSLGYTFEDNADSANELTVNRATLTLAGLAAADKLFDGNTTAAVTNFGTLDGVVDGDVLVLATGSAQAHFDTALSGDHKPVTITDLGLTGIDAANYTLADASTTATITVPTPEGDDSRSVPLNAITTGLFATAGGTNGTADMTDGAAPSAAAIETIQPGMGPQTLEDIKSREWVADCTAEAQHSAASPCRNGSR